MYQHATFRRRSSSTSSTASTVSWASDHHHDESGRAARGSQDLNSAASSPPPASTNANVRTCEGMTADETRELWKCMLALQQRYGCYNSRRIDLAANAGDDGVNLMREFAPLPLNSLHLHTLFSSSILSVALRDAAATVLSRA